MGTRFLLARESGAHPAYRRRLLAATEEDTVVTRVFTGRPARGLRNRFVEEYVGAGSEPLAWPLQRAAAGDIYRASQAADDGDYSPLLAGQGLRMLREDGQGAAEIVAGVVAEAEAVLARLGGASSEAPTE
jgi:nitronate monooxygenase